jgi:hypothetical protein
MSRNADWREERALVAGAVARHSGRIGTGRLRLACPVCEVQRGVRDTSLALSVEPPTGLYYCWRCHAGGKLTEALIAAADLTAPELAAQGDDLVDPPEGYMPLGLEPWASSESLADARAYAAYRKLSPALIAELGVGAVLSGKLAGRMILPILAPGQHVSDARWSGWVGRDWTGLNERKHTYPSGMNRSTLVFNEAAIDVETDVPMLCVEAVLDATPHWPHAMAFLGKPSPGQLAKLGRAKRPVVSVLDGDAHEESWALAMRLRFDGHRAGYVKLPPKRDPHLTDPTWLMDAAVASLDAPL